MEKTRTKRVAVPLGDGSYRETTIELVQVYHDNTKKLVKTEEKSRVEGKLYRQAKPGEKSDTQLMDEKSFEVLSLVEITEKKAPPTAPKTQEEAVVPPTSDEEPKDVQGVDEVVVGDIQEADEKGVEPNEDGQQSESVEASDDSKEVEDDMATKKKAAKKAEPKKTEKGAKKVEPKKTEPKKTEPKKTKTEKAAKKVEPKKVEKAAKKVEPKKAPVKPPKEDSGSKEKKVPSSGQSGPTLDLAGKKLNSKEEKVLGALSNGAGKMTIAELTDLFKKSVAVAKANSWVRNSLRRLVRGGLVKKAERGTYEATAKGRKHSAA